MPQPHAWFEFPSGDDSTEAVRALAAQHVGRELIGLSTPIPGERSISLVQVLTFVDPQLGFRHLFSDDTCARFRAFALSLHAGFRTQEQLLIAALVGSARPVSAAFGASAEEIFLLAPTRTAPVVQSAIQELLEKPGSLVNPMDPLPGTTRSLGG